ncbi:hypothetical protein STEG23_034567, partial [Scotinomys teguina]
VPAFVSLLKFFVSDQSIIVGFSLSNLALSVVSSLFISCLDNDVGMFNAQLYTYYKTVTTFKLSNAQLDTYYKTAKPVCINFLFAIAAQSSNLNEQSNFKLPLPFPYTLDNLLIIDISYK